MHRAPFPSFPPASVARFCQQIRDAWRDAGLPQDRETAVPCHCPECDDLWEWLQNVDAIDAEQTRVDWPVTWFLLTPAASAYALGHCLLRDASLSSGDQWGHAMSALDADFNISPGRFEAVFGCLAPRQRWCVLKMLIWCYLEEPDENELTAIRRLRDLMGYHANWPTPPPHAQT